MKKRHTIAPYLRKEWAANYRPGDRKRIYEVTQIHPRTLERALQDGIASDEVQHAITTFFKNRLQKEIEAAKELKQLRDEKAN